MNTITLKEVDSTNLYAKENLSDLPDKTIITTERQTKGRGRLTRSWIDLGGENLFMTLVLKPSNYFKPVYANLTQYLSVVLCSVLEEYGLSTEIKWPNDVQIKGGKIAGILSETVMQGSNFKGLVLGIGVNLNANENDLKKVVDKSVTALNLEIETLIQVNKKEFTDKLVTKFFENYDEFLAKGFEMIKKDYTQRLCILGQEITIQGFNDIKSGIAKEINNAGELVLEKDKKELILTMGDIL